MRIKLKTYFVEELFKKSDLLNIYSKFLSEKIEEIGVDNLPKEYQEEALARIVSDEDITLEK